MDIKKVTTVLKVVVTGEFCDDDLTEETLRYAVEQDLEDAGFDVDVALLKEQEAVKPVCKILFDIPYYFCGQCNEMLNMYSTKAMFCSKCGHPVKWGAVKRMI